MRVTFDPMHASHPLGVVRMPEEVNGSLRRALELVTGQDDMQYVVQYESDRLHICRVAIDRSTRSVASDVDFCPQYTANVWFPFRGPTQCWSQSR